MKKIGLLVLVMVFVLGLSVQAGVSTGKEASSAKEITINGSFDNTMVSRDSGVTSVLDCMPAPGKQASDLFWSPLITLNFGVDVGDKVTALVQLQNRRLDAALGTTANVDFFGGDNIEMAVEQAYIQVEKLIIEELTLKYGGQSLKFSAREGGDAFFMDTNNSRIMALPYTEANIYKVVGALAKDTCEFGGFRFDYGSLKNNNYKASFYWGVVNESLTGRADERLTGLAGWYKIPGGDPRNIATGTISKTFNEGTKLSIQTIGVGGNYFGSMPNLELYGEYYTQSGDFSATVDQASSAYRIGGKYDIKNEKLKPYVDVSYWYLSGGGSTTKNKNFMSYENVQSTMILEDNIWGLDIDSNYKVLKMEAGLTHKLDVDKDGTAEPLNVKLLFGTFSLVADPASKTAGQTVSKNLGTEIDVVATLHFNKSLSFTLGYATLSGGDFFTSAGGYGVKEDSMQMIVLDSKLKF
ncbi:MAG: alginate export family protein [Candidatus Brocadiia bacterium]